MKQVTVIVPVRNEARSIEKTLRSLLHQDYAPEDFEIIVVDGCSTDETVALVRKLQLHYPHLLLLHNPNRLSSSARNLAVRHMSGRFAVIVDGHCDLNDPEYLSKLVRIFEETGADSLGRPQPLTTSSPSSFQRAVARARQSRLGHNPESDIFSETAKFVPPQSTAVAYRRSVFTTIGLFDQNFDACEDVDFNHRLDRAGMNCYFSPELKVIYQPRSSFRSLFFQLARYGAGRARLALKDFRSLSLPAIVPPLWLLILAIGPLFCLIFPGLTKPFLVLLGLYGLLILLGSLVVGLHEAFAVKLRLPVVFLAIHFGFAWGFIAEISRACQRMIKPLLYRIRISPFSQPKRSWETA